jgi:hypothetical protein
MAVHEKRGASFFLVHHDLLVAQAWPPKQTPLSLQGMQVLSGEVEQHR